MPGAGRASTGRKNGRTLTGKQGYKESLVFSVNLLLGVFPNLVASDLVVRNYYLAWLPLQSPAVKKKKVVQILGCEKLSEKCR